MANSVIMAPSILAADFAHLAAEIEMVEKGGADLLHLDIMDGHFVPNITIGPPVVASIRKFTNLPLDAHLMISEPARFIDDLVSAGVNWISTHVEADVHLNRTIQHIKDKGIRAGVALNPATPLGTLEEVLPLVDFVLVMSVNPGFGGQRFIPSTINKIGKLREKISSNRYRARIEVDGGIDSGNLRDVLAAGADVIVSGSAIFRSKMGPSAALQEMIAMARRQMVELDRV